MGAVECLIMIFIVLNRRNWERLAAVFLSICALLFGAERLNGLARLHWKSFSSQQYFDEHGAFASVIVGLPCLICQFLIICFLLKEAASMVVKVKRMELKKDMKNKKKDQ